MSKGLSKEDTKQDHPLQCILLCDAWGEEQRWGPLVRRSNDDEDDEDQTDEERFGKGETRPWCLLPLLDIPLLAWSLECLAASGVEQIFIFVNNGIEEVRSWLASSIYSQAHYPLSVILRPTTAQTPGDIMREVDSLQILAPADFLVVQVGYVANVDLKLKVEQFAEKRKADPSLAMSCVVAPRSTPTTSKSVVHMLSSDQQLLHYEEGPVYPRRKRAQLPRAALDGCKQVTVRGDLESVGVQICSVEVPPLFTENFDYQFFYPGFVVGILTSDLLGKTICCTVIGEDRSTLALEEQATSSSRTVEWAAVVGNTKSYDFISKSLLSRKAFPLVPDENMPNDIDRYDPRRGRVYLGKDLDLSRTSTVGSTSLLGHSTAIGPQSVITRSVLSPHTMIAASCTITNCYLFEGVRVGEGCVLVDSVLGENVVVGEGSRIEGGSLIGARVEIGRNARVMGCRVGSVAFEHDDAESAASVGNDAVNLGHGSNGFIWPSESSVNGAAADDDDDDDEVDPRNYDITRLGARLSTTLHLSASHSSSSLSSMSHSSSSTSISSSTASQRDRDEDQDFDGEPAAIVGLSSLTPASAQSDFLSECTQSLERSFEEGHTVDNAAIELKTLRMASNVALGQVRDVVVPFLLQRCLGVTPSALLLMIRRWGGLVASLTGDNEEAMVDCLHSVQRFVIDSMTASTTGAGSGAGAGADLRFFLRVLKSFYEEDIVSDEAIFEWYKSKKAREIGKGSAGGGSEVWIGSKGFVAALAEAVAEDDDDDEEDEDDDDDEDDDEVVTMMMR